MINVILHARRELKQPRFSARLGRIGKTCGPAFHEAASSIHIQPDREHFERFLAGIRLLLAGQPFEICKQPPNKGQTSGKTSGEKKGHEQWKQNPTAFKKGSYSVRSPCGDLEVPQFLRKQILILAQSSLNNSGWFITAS